MTEHLTKRFIDHRNVRLAPQAIAELAFHHAKGGLDIGALVVVAQELIPPILEVMKHPFPSAAPAELVIRGEGHKRYGSQVDDSVQIASRCVALVRRDFRALKVLSRGIDKSRKLARIAGVP